LGGIVTEKDADGGAKHWFVLEPVWQASRLTGREVSVVGVTVKVCGTAVTLMTEVPNDPVVPTAPKTPDGRDEVTKLLVVEPMPGMMITSQAAGTDDCCGSKGAFVEASALRAGTLFWGFAAILCAAEAVVVGATEAVTCGAGRPAIKRDPRRIPPTAGTAVRGVTELLSGDADAAAVGGVAAVKRLPQGLLSPATPPTVASHAARMSARVLRVATVTLSFAGKAGPGVVPFVTSTSSFTDAKSLAKSAASAALEPMAVGEVMYVSRAKTVATVVSSLMTIGVAEVTELHAPRADMRVMAVLSVPTARPGLPPVAVM
jgi:hypothetical protein